MRSLGCFVVLAICVLGTMGCCDEQVKVVVLPGHAEPRACIEAIKSGKTAPVTVLCGGKEVTVCWGSNKQDVKIDPMGITSHGQHVGSNFGGVEYFKPTANVTVKVTASDCAWATQDVLVISGDTPFHFDAGWLDAKCQQIDFSLDPVFVDPDARAISITALWTPFVTDANGNPVACKTPPFLDGFKKPDLFGFKVDEPNLTKAFTQPLQVAGDWLFTPKFTCPTTGDTECNQYAVFPFTTTVRCPPPP